MPLCNNSFVINMKKIGIVCLIILCTGCSIFNKKEEPKPKETTQKTNDIEEDIPKEPEYVDDNNTPIGLYERNGSKLNLLSEFNTKVQIKKDIKTFQAFPSTESEINHLGKRYAEYYYEKYIEVNESRKYKTGFNLKYTLNDGTKISQNIFGPSTTQTNYDYIEVYLYDAYKHRNDSFYSHIEEKDFNDETIITSIKLTAGSKFNDIKSKITLTVFTYDEDDFDKNGEYRGNSKYSVVISDLSKNYDE